MGEVYRARDTTLNRDVALKILPETFAADADRIARFKREAQVLASLNHSNIAQIYGIESNALVMELVEGEDLSEVIGALRNPGALRTVIPLADAIAIAKQISDALEAAHEQGIVHRDLKPANIKVRADGTVKVLDFGLAKTAEAAPTSGVSAMNSPTMTSPVMTGMGMILGTAAYMSPEQAKGRPVDKRADIWAFGAVLYEILSGRRAFEGDDVSDLLVAVLSKDVDLTALPPATPHAITELIRRCLVRDPKQRLRDIGEARVILSQPLEPVAADPRSIGRVHARTGLIAAMAAVVLIAAIAGWYVGTRNRDAASTPAPYRAEIVPFPPDAFGRQATASVFTFTPDGRTLIYASTDPLGRRLYRRDRDSQVAVPIAGTDGAYGPFVSQDGTSIGFFANGSIKRVPLGGGAAEIIHNMRAAASVDAIGFGWITELGPGREIGYGATWLVDGTIAYGRFSGGLWRVSTASGTPSPITKVAPGEIAHRLPRALPGGRAILCTVIRDMIGIQDSSVEAVDLTTGTRTKLVSDATDGRYDGDGQLLFARRGSLFAIKFDAVSLRTSGDPVKIADDVMHAIGGGRPGQASGVAQYDVSVDGALAVLGGGTNAGAARRAVWVSRGGETTPVSSDPLGNLGPRLSADNTRIAIRKSPDVVIVNVQEGIATPLAQNALFPVWHPDQSQVLVAHRTANGQQDIYSVSLAGGAPELVIGGSNPLWPSSVSTDGKFLAYVESSPNTGNDIWIAGLSPKTAPVAMAATAASEAYPMFSPNGKWLAFVVEDGDSAGVYVRPFPELGRAERIAGPGSTAPVWTRDGRSILYGRLSPTADFIQEIVQVSVDTGGDRVRVGPPVTFASGLFNWSTPVSSFDITKDGSRIVATVDAPPPAGAQGKAVAGTMLHLTLNWKAGLPK
jgi:serine/threonine-protein kinase